MNTNVRRANARWVFDRYYACMVDLVHPGNLGALPPSPRTIAYKASFLGLMDGDHLWITAYL